MDFSKGHGIGNDFVLHLDPSGTTSLNDDQIRRLTDRHRGIGGDGYIRATKAKNIPDFAEYEPLGVDPEDWFMDYYNADGSLSQMCGNGVRVFVHFLIHKKAIDLPVGQSLSIGTRAGRKEVTRIEDNVYSIDMGKWGTPLLQEQMTKDPAAQTDSHVKTPLRDSSEVYESSALSLSMGNPHTVARVSSQEVLNDLDLLGAPEVSPVPPEGTNAEFVVIEHAHDNGKGCATMRVHERGVGETLACGTGACAVAAAARLWQYNNNSDLVNTWDITLPGGVLTIDFKAASSDENKFPTILDSYKERTIMTGQAVIVADGTTSLV